MTQLSSHIDRLIDQYFSNLIASSNSPSASKAPGGICGVLCNGQVYFKAFGYINQDYDAPTEDTIFGLGSVTKTFTTSIIGQTPTAARDTPLSDIPQPAGYNLQPNLDAATFNQLVSFTAGINPSDPPNAQASQSDFIAFINSIAPPHAPPQINSYSNSSIGFAAQVAMGLLGTSDFSAKATNEWWTDFLFSSLGLEYTGAPANPDTEHPLAQAYKFDGTGYAPVEYQGWVPWGAAGRAYSTCQEMMYFIQANVGYATVNGQELSKVVLDGLNTATTPYAPMGQPDSETLQAMAWTVRNAHSAHPIAVKNGGLTGVSAAITACKVAQVGVVFLTNMQGVEVTTPAVALSEALIKISDKTPISG